MPDTALVHLSFVDAGCGGGFGFEKDTPSNLSAFFTRGSGGSVCTRVVGGLEVGEAGSWYVRASPTLLAI